MYKEKLLRCDCCGRIFRRRSNLFLEDQKHFFNKHHRLRYKPTVGSKQLTITESRMKKYNEAGSGNF